MSAYKSEFLNIPAERGFILQISEPEDLDTYAKASPRRRHEDRRRVARMGARHVGTLRRPRRRPSQQN